MADLDKLEICLKETKHLNTVLIPALKESIMITSMELEAAELEIKDLITELNDKDTKLNKARKSRLYWGVGGALAGAVVYSILAK